MKSVVLEKIPGILYGFGSEADPVPPALSKFWDSRAQWKQVHGIASCEVKTAQQPCGDVDGLWSREKKIPIAVVSADCLPVLFSRKDGGAIAAVHAGWRGVYARITRELWTSLSSQGESPIDWVAVIGPSIGDCCYEVGLDLLDQFTARFSEIPKKEFIDKRMLNLKAIAVHELRSIGISEVEVLPYCTRCSTNPRFQSYRRSGSGQRQWSGLVKV